MSFAGSSGMAGSLLSGMILARLVARRVFSNVEAAEMVEACLEILEGHQKLASEGEQTLFAEARMLLEVIRSGYPLDQKS